MIKTYEVVLESRVYDGCTIISEKRSIFGHVLRMRIPYRTYNTHNGKTITESVWVKWVSSKDVLGLD